MTKEMAALRTTTTIETRMRKTGTIQHESSATRSSSASSLSWLRLRSITVVIGSFRWPWMRASCSTVHERRRAVVLDAFINCPVVTLTLKTPSTTLATSSPAKKSAEPLMATAARAIAIPKMISTRRARSERTLRMRVAHENLPAMFSYSTFCGRGAVSARARERERERESRGVRPYVPRARAAERAEREGAEAGAAQRAARQGGAGRAGPGSWFDGRSEAHKRGASACGSWAAAPRDRCPLCSRWRWAAARTQAVGGSSWRRAAATIARARRAWRALARR